MKKVITFALVLALTLVLAAPALAITGTVVTTPTTVAQAPFHEANYSFIFTTYKPTTPLNLLSVSEVAANKAYINYEMLYWRFNVVTNYDNTTMEEVDYSSPAVRLTSDVVTFNGDVDYFTVTNIGVTDNNDLDGLTGGNTRTLVFDIPYTAAGADTNYVFVGSALVDKNVNGTIKLEVLGRKTSAKFASTVGWDFETQNNDGTIYTVTGDTLYTLSGDGTEFGVTRTYNSTPYTVSFLMNGTTGNNVTGIKVNDDTVEFVVLPSGGGAVVNRIGTLTGTALANSDAYKAYNDAMNFFGFNYNAEGTLVAKNFAVKLSAYYWTTSKAVNIYNAVVTIPDTTTPPKTGDNASVLGFVMVAAAVLAVVALGYKKVRE